MELRQLRYLFAIAEERSFTRAAEKLYVSQSALSQQIKLLERELDVVLFDRSERRVLLTPAGEALRRHARRVFQALEEASAEIGELEALQRGELVVSAVETVVAYVVPKAVSAFTQRYPGVRVRVEEQADEQIEQRLLDGSVDVGLGFVPAIYEEVETEPLYTERLALIVPRGHALASRTTVAVADVQDLPMVLLPPSSCTRTQWDASASQAGIQPRLLAEMNTIHGILQAVLETNTATILPAFAPNAAFDGTFVSIPLIDPTPQRVVGILYRRNGYRSRAVQAFADVIRAVAPAGL